MFSSKSTDHLAFVSRQLSYLLSSEELEPALQRLAQVSPKQYGRDIEYLRNVLSGSAAEGPSLGPNAYTTLSKLLSAVDEDRNGFFRRFVDYVDQSKVVFETYWAGVVGMLWYLAALTIVALIVATTFGAFVVPSFTDMFSQFGQPMPELTTVVFAFSGAGIPLFAILLTLVFALVIWFAVQFHSRIQRLAPLPRWPRWLPIVGALTESYNLGLFLNFARILVESGVETARAVTQAAKAANLSADLDLESLTAAEGDFEQNAVLTELAVGARLGYFDAEIAFQSDRHIGRLSVALVEARDRFSLLLKFGMYLFVGILVVAMYLPIFKLGSAI